MITKLLSPNTPNPKTAGPNGDWDLAMAQLTAVKKLLAGEQMMLTEWTNSTTQPKIALGTHLQHKGSIYVVDTEDYALPALGGNGTYYIVLEGSGETLVGSWVTSLSGFAWDATYNGLYNGDALALPYQVVVDGAAVSKRKILNPWSTGAFSCVNYLGVVYGPSIEVSGDITATGKLIGATVNTGYGDFEVGQNLRTTDSVYFNGIGFGIRTWDEGTPYVQRIINAKAGTQIVASSDENVGTGGTSYTKRKELVSFCTGTVSVTFSIRGNLDNRQYGATACVYKNGVPIGTEKHMQGDSPTFHDVTEDFSVVEGDLIQLYGKSDVSGKEGSLKEFRIMTLRGFIT